MTQTQPPASQAVGRMNLHHMASYVILHPGLCFRGTGVNNLTIEALKCKSVGCCGVWKSGPAKKRTLKSRIKSNGAKAATNSPATWSHVRGCHRRTCTVERCWVRVMGEVDGVHLCGVDLDNCCDACDGQIYTGVQRQLSLAWTATANTAQAGTGAHILMLGTLRGRKGIKLPFHGHQGCGAV